MHGEEEVSSDEVTVQTVRSVTVLLQYRLRLESVCVVSRRSTRGTTAPVCVCVRWKVACECVYYFLGVK